MDEFDALRVSGQELARRLAVVRPEHLQRPSVLAGWSVFDLANHVIGGGLRYTLILADADAETMQATRTQDHVGADPVAAHNAYQRDLEASFAQPETLTRIVHHPSGDRTGLELLHMRIAEQALHAVDLARSLGVDESLDAELVDYMLARVAPEFDFGRAHGFFADPGHVADEASRQSRLLALSGR